MPVDGIVAGDANAQLVSSTEQATAAVPYLFNEATYDRRRGNTTAPLAVSAARTAGVSLGSFTNYNARGIVMVLNITAASGTGGLTVILEGFDSASGLFYTILQSALFTATTAQPIVLRAYPGLVAAANLTANDVLPRTWRVRVTAGDGSSYTYSLGQSLVL